MIRPLACLLAVIGLACTPGSSLAEDLANEPEAEISTTAQDARVTRGLFGTQAVSETTLQASAGREDTAQVSQADLRAGVSQNSVGDNSVTGAANIDGNAFQNMSGLSILNVNTGNNVAINAAMNVNISISASP